MCHFYLLIKQFLYLPALVLILFYFKHNLVTFRLYYIDNEGSIPLNQQPSFHSSPTNRPRADGPGSPLFISFQIVAAVIPLAAPVNTFGDLRFLRQFNAFHNPFIEFIKSGAVDNVADVLLALDRLGVNIFLDVGVAVLDHLHDALLVAPLDKVFGKTRVLLAGTSQQHNAEVMFFAARPCAGRAVRDADTTADAQVGVPLNLAVDHRERADGTFIAVFDALLAADATVFIILRLRHADDTEIIHAHLRAVIGAAGEGNLHVQVVRENHLFHLAGKSTCVITAERTDA